MTARNTLWTQGGSTSAEEDRALATGLYTYQGSGLLGCSGADGKVIQHGTPNMSVDVAPFRCVIAGTENALQGMYQGWLDASQNVTIAASDPSNARIDLIVAKIQDAQYSGSTNAFSVVAITGTASGSPVAPAAPANSIILAQIAVAAAATSIVTANITDKRVWTGSRNWNDPWGILNYIQVVANQTGITAAVDLTGLTLTTTFVANRRVKITGSALASSASANDQVGLVLTDSAAVTINQGNSVSMPVANKNSSVTVQAVVTPAAGSKLYKLRMLASPTGPVTMTATANLPAFLLIEDIGPNGNPA